MVPNTTIRKFKWFTISTYRTFVLFYIYMFYFSFRDQVRGVEVRAYISDAGISSSRDYVDKRWACSKYKKYDVQCQIC